MIEIPDKLTTLQQTEFILTAARAWKRFYGWVPRADQLACCLAQMVLETGRERDPARPGAYLWGKYAHNFNWGNIKSREGDGLTHQYYACGEEVSLDEALKLDRESPGLIQIIRRYKWPNGSQRASIMIFPKHPWSRFRAYESAEDGLVGYLRFLVMDRDRYKKAWGQGVLAGDVVKFSTLLGKAGYYTADPARYTRTMVALFGEFLPEVEAILSPLREEQDREQDDKELQVVVTSIWESLRREFGKMPEAMDEGEAHASITPNVPTALS